MIESMIVEGGLVSQMSLVDYLDVDGPGSPRLLAHECVACGARFFDRRNGCASCSGTEFRSVEVASEGVLRTFTIVHFAAEGVPVPFVAGVVDCEGTAVRGNVVNVPPDPDHVRVGMKLRLTTVPLTTDVNGVRAVGYGFEPID
jgi:uncharacterized OB-fold protein